jgi:hypothetical protein
LVDLPRFGVAIEVTEKTLTIFGGSFCEVIDEGLDRFATGVTEGWCTAVVSGKGLDEGGIELMLADQQAETITQTWLTVVMAIGSYRRRFTMIGINRT